MAKPKRLPPLAFAVAAAELGILLAPAPIRVPAGLILFFLPGLMFTRVLQSRTRIEGTEQLLLVPGASLVVAVITGLLLHTAHIPLTTGSWAVALGLLTAAGLALMALREGERDVGRRRRPLPPSTGIAPAAMFVTAALAVSAAVVIGALGQRDRDSETEFTQLWALPGPSSGSAVQLGVRSHERGAVRYHIRVSVDGREVRSQALTLRPGEMWQSKQPVPASGQRVDVALLTSPQGPVYREVHLTAG